MRPDDRICGADAAAYVLGALDPAEAEAFQRHLADCAICRDEIGALTQTADALPLSARQLQPPRRLRKRLMRAVEAERKGAPAAPASRPGRSLRPRARLPRGALAGVVAAAVALAVVGGVELSSGGSTQARVIQASVFAGRGSAQLRVSGARAELVVQHLPAPRTGHIYELWLQRPGRLPAPTNALFSVTTTGTAEVGVPGDLRGVSSVLVTQEPAGGSPTPTSMAVIVARLS